MANKVIHCKFCDKILKDEDDYGEHIFSFHPEQIIPGMVPRQFVYYLRTGKTEGRCVVCKEPTAWNDVTCKYNRLCGKKSCKDELRNQFKDHMIGKYGKTTLLDDPEQQKKMLAARKISGVYQWSDRNPKHKFTYTGSYEKGFLVFLDRVFELPPEDLMAPSPHVYYYMYEGKKHFYMPDFFIPSLNLEIEIKDGGANPNTHPKIQAVDKEKERLKDEVLSSNGIPFDYLKITDQKNILFFKYLEKAKERDINGYSKKIVMI